MKTCIAALALFSLAGLAFADELEDSYTKLKDAVAKKDADSVKATAGATLKLAKAAETAPKPSGADEAKTWQERIDYAKEVEGYTEYALANTAEQPGVEPAKAVELVDILLAQNPKSKYLDDICVNAYLVALGKSAPAGKQKAAQTAGMLKVVKAQPENTVALQALVEAGQSAYAPRLIAAMRTKAKPEGISEGDWEKEKNAALATGYYWAGMGALQKQSWTDCEKNLKAAVPLVSNEQAQLGNTYYGLGVCIFNYGKAINDRVKMKEGEQYSEKSAAIKSPSQDQAYRNVAIMKQALGGR